MNTHPAAMNSYLLWIDNKQAGPFTMTQMKSMWLDGRITSDTLFWREESQGWEGLGGIVENAITNERQPDAAQRVQNDKGWTTVDFSILVVCTILIPIAGLIVGFVGVFNPVKRQRAASLMGIALLVMAIWWGMLGR